MEETCLGHAKTVNELVIIRDLAFIKMHHSSHLPVQECFWGLLYAVITKTRSIFIQEELYSLSSCHESMSDRQSHNHHQHQRLCRDYPAREDSRICPSIGWVALDPWRISLVARTCPSRLITYQGWTKSVQINNLSLFLRGNIKHRRKMFHSFWAMDWYEKCFFLSYKAILDAQWPRRDDNGPGMCNG